MLNLCSFISQNSFFSQAVSLDTESCNDIIQKDNIISFEMRKSTAIQGSQTCIYGQSELKNSNKLSIEQFITCKTNLKSLRRFNMFEITCNVTKNTEPRDCQTFLELKEHRIECLKVCWTFPFDFVTICDQKPISYIFRNSMIILLSLLAVIIGIGIGKNWYAIKVSFY